jgi:AraC family transcriptional regulator
MRMATIHAVALRSGSMSPPRQGLLRWQRWSKKAGREPMQLIRPGAPIAQMGIRRRTLHSSGLGRVEDFGAPGEYPALCGHSPEYQVVLPYTGAFEWHVGAKTVFVDGTRVLFVNAGEDYAYTHVAGCGHDSIIVTPHLSMLQELCGHPMPSRHPAFQRVTKPVTPRLNMLTHRLLRVEASRNDPLARDELMIALLGEALAPTQRVARAAPPRVVDRAKQFLHARLCEATSLNAIAHEVQVSGAYLTDAFTRSEGVPLCHYRMRLRLNGALAQLPRCEDISSLALDLGFSSHAHFSTAFKSLFGVSPSAFRSGCSKPRRAVRVAPACANAAHQPEPGGGIPA